MVDRPKTRFYSRLAIILALGAVSLASANSDFFTGPTWQPVSSDAVFARLTEYLNTAHIAPERQVKVREQWKASAGDEGAGDLLDRLASSMANADDRVKELVDFCATGDRQIKLPEFAWLADSDTPLLVRNNMRVFWARWLVQAGYYDEAISWTDGLTTADVVAPEALLFYRAIAHHRLVQPDAADGEVTQLLQRQDELPLRYQKLSDLMQKDLATLQDESLDHIARRMDDVRRRLAQGRAGDRVQQVENGVVESLDKMIKDIEKQLQQQAQAAQARSSGGQPSAAPMQDSQIAELKAPGEVEHRDVGRGTGWGDLPEKDREKAMQEIGREFPSHYREVVEEYFRRLAAEESDEKP